MISKKSKRFSYKNDQVPEPILLCNINENFCEKIILLWMRSMVIAEKKWATLSERNNPASSYILPLASHNIVGDHLCFDLRVVWQRKFDWFHR